MTPPFTQTDVTSLLLYFTEDKLSGTPFSDVLRQLVFDEHEPQISPGGRARGTDRTFSEVLRIRHDFAAGCAPGNLYLPVYGNIGLLALAGSNNSGNGETVRATPKLAFEPPSWHGFTHKFLPCYGAQLIDNFVGNDDKAMVTAATVAALKLKNPWAAGAALVVWTGANAFQAGSACAVSSRAVSQ